MSFFTMLDRGVEKFSERAFEAAQSDRPQRHPSHQQTIVKAISDGHADEAQIQEAIEFSLASRNGNESAELTPLGTYILSGHPPAEDAAAAAAAAKG